MKQLYMDSAFRISYNKNNLNLSQFPNRPIVTRGMQGVLTPAELFFAVPKQIDKSYSKVIAIKPKNMNNKGEKRGHEKIVKSDKRLKKPKIKVTQC